jgi:HEAT repeat protein
MKTLLGIGVLCTGLFLAPAARAEEVQELIDKLKSSDSDVRRDAAQALGKMGPQAKEAVPALVAALQDKNLFVRRYSAHTLGKIGSDAAKQAVPALTKTLDDKRKEVAEAAAEALGQMGTSAVKPLVKAVKDKGTETSVRQKAVTSLGQIGPEAREAVPALMTVLKGKDNEEVRVEAATALGNIGSAARPALSELSAAAQLKGKKNAPYKKAAAEAVRKIESSQK